MTKPLLTDETARTVSIPVSVRGGQVLALDGRELPRLSECVGDLIVPAFAVLDADILECLSKERCELLFEKGDVLLCRLSRRYLSDKHIEMCPQEMLYHELTKEPFVPIHLVSPLFLRWRGTKKARLEPAKCSIPLLRGLQVDSVNEAYKRISQEYEPGRRSAGGNVFLNVYFHRRGERGCRPLDDLRGRLPDPGDRRLL